MSEFIDKLTDLQKLVEYVKSNGGKVAENVSFQVIENEGIGIFAAEDTTAREVLVEVPFSICTSTDVMVNHPKLQPIFVDNPGLLSYPDEVAAIGLMYAISNPDADCPWKLHVQTMPNSINTPLFWSDSEVQELQGCTAYYLTGLMKNQIANDYAAIHYPLSQNYPSQLGKITIATYMWALSMVYSRSIEIVRNQRVVRCIVPVVDMANHDPNTTTEPCDTLFYDDKTDTVRFISATSFRKGDECFAVYGKYTNAKLLYTYGFVLMDNPYRAVDLWAKPNSSNYAWEQKHQILNSHPLTNNQWYDFSGTIRSNFIAPSLLATIRVIQTNEEEMELIENAFCGKIISVRNEQATYVSLKNLILLKMKVEKAEVIVYLLFYLTIVEPAFILE